jgi:hypothetical protein
VDGHQGMAGESLYSRKSYNLRGGSDMRLIILILSLGFILHLSFAQVTIQGTVTASAEQTAPIIDASVQFFRLDINGKDTARVVLGTVRTDQSGHFSYLLATDVQTTQQDVPKQFALSASYPNPFQTRTQVGLDVPKPDNFAIAVYNILGQEIARLEKALTAGSYSIQWDGSTIPGVYFVVVKAGGDMRFIKLIQLQKNSSPSALRITGVSSSFQTKVSGTQNITAASSVQVTVSKQLYQTYVSPVLTYSNQSLPVPLTYVGTGPVSASKRDSAFKSTAAQFTALSRSLSRTDAAKAMTDALRNLPQFENAGASGDGNVWCRFTDGTMAIFVNNRQMGDTSGLHLTLAETRSPQFRLASSPPASDIPTKNVFVSCAALGPSFGGTGGHLDAVTALAGYTSSWQDGVDQLKSNINDVSLFFVDAHGGYGEVPWGGTEFAVWTNTKQSHQKDSIYYDDLREHRLVWMYAMYNIDRSNPASPDTIRQWNYAFTGQFVRKYMSFAKNSLVYIDACSSATNNVFVNSFFAKGASAFAGYSATADAAASLRSTVLFFDRTIGANYPKIFQETPPQRAFDWPAVLNWMQSKGEDKGSGDGTAKLIVLPNSGSKLGPLAPSIASMFVHPYDQKLYIYGMFGENPGEDGVVTIGGSPSQVMEWAYDGTSQMDRIVCKIQDEGAGSYGDVQVKVRGIKSNVSPLSRYKGEVKYIHDTGDGRNFEAKLTLQFRVHMLGFRMKPGDKPIFNQSTYLVNADMGSKGECSAGGSTGPLIWFGGANDMHNNIDGGNSQKGYEAGAWFDPEQKKVQLYMSGMAINGITQTDGTSTSSLNLVFGTDEFEGKRDNLPSYVEIPLAADFSIKKDSRSATKINTYFSAGKADKVRIEWGDITCEAPPKDDTAR